MNIQASHASYVSSLALRRFPCHASAMTFRQSSLMGQNLLHRRVASIPVCRQSRAINTQIRAAFLGVGAPEALLVGVVALVLFGPKGLAQAVRSIGDTLKAFAPTIREITQVSTELKSTLEEEIGLNDLREELQRPLIPTPRPAKIDRVADTVPQEAMQPLSELSNTMQQVDDTMAMTLDPEIEKKRQAAAQLAWGGQQPLASENIDGNSAVSLTDLSIDELEKELARRKAASQE